MKFKLHHIKLRGRWLQPNNGQIPFSLALNYPSPSIPIIKETMMCKKGSIYLLIPPACLCSLLLSSFLHLICLSYIALGFVFPITNHECGISIFEAFLLFPSKNTLSLVFGHFTWISMFLGQLIHMPCILSTPGVVVTSFWSLSSIGIEFF